MPIYTSSSLHLQFLHMEASHRQCLHPVQRSWLENLLLTPAAHLYTPGHIYSTLLRVVRTYRKLTYLRAHLPEVYIFAIDWFHIHEEFHMIEVLPQILPICAVNRFPEVNEAFTSSFWREDSTKLTYHSITTGECLGEPLFHRCILTIMWYLQSLHKYGIFCSW